MTSLYLVRHAQSKPSRELSTPDWPLSEKGRRQAQALKAILAKLAIDKIYSSPYLRCQETIRPFSEQSGLPIHKHEDLREIKLVPHFVKNFDEIQRKSWSYFSFALPGCETSSTCQQRMLSSLLEIALANFGKTIAVSSHSNAIALFLNKLDANFKYDEHKSIRNPDIFHVQFDGEAFHWQKDFSLEGELAALTNQE